MASMPLDVQATNTSNKRSFNISWSAPLTTGNQLPIELSYKLVYCNEMGCDEQRADKGMMYSILNRLALNTTYNVTVSAISLNDLQGPGSNVSFRTPENGTDSFHLVQVQLELTSSYFTFFNGQQSFRNKASPGKKSSVVYTNSFKEAQMLLRVSYYLRPFFLIPFMSVLVNLQRRSHG